MTAVVAALLVTAPVAGAQQRSTERDFRWEGNIPSGRWLYLRNLNGSIQVEKASSNRVEVAAHKRWRRGNPEDVTIEVKKAGPGSQDVIICALWYDNTDCDEDGYNVHENRWGRDRNNDVTVEFTVKLPAGVKLDASSINGGIEIDGASSVVEAHTVNGRVVATSTGGPVNAGTVNGDIEVRMATVGSDDLKFSTVNGSIEVVVPDGINADVDMRTVNGSVNSDFPMTVSGRINPRHIRATIGKGGRRIEFRTVNGSVELRKL
jgi:hypothetical protein